MRKVSASVIGLMVASLGMSAARAQQSKPFASSAEYESMLTELAREAPRPSRISAAGELLLGDHSAVEVEETLSPSGLSLETKVWRLDIRRDPFQFTFSNKLTGVDWRLGIDNVKEERGVGSEPKSKSPTSDISRFARIGKIEKQNGHWILEGIITGSSQAAKIDIAVLSPNTLGLSMDASGLGKEAEFEFHIDASGPLFGLGEQFANVNSANFKIDLHPEDKYGTPGHNWDYMSIPFVYNPKGNGIYFDTAFNCSFDSTGVGQEGFTMRVGGPIVDLYLIAGQGPKKVLESYTAITGRTPLPPPWAFGVWLNALQGRDAVLRVAENLRSAKIPVSAIWVFDLMDQKDCMGWPLWTYGYYAPIGQFTEALHKLGFKVLTYIDPYVRSLLIPYPLENPDFTEAVGNHYLVTNPDGQPAGPTFEPDLTGNVDFTNPDAVNWWQKKLGRVLERDDFDGWMEDFGEAIKDDQRFAVGKTGRVMATLYPLIYHKTSYEISHQIKPDVVEFDRSGAPGSQAFTRVLWGGDQAPDWSEDNGLPAVVKAGISAGLSGFAVWGPDILSSGTSKELWIRWTEFGALSPIMRDHLWDKPKFAVDLWFDSETLDVFRQYARLHISLFPYFYTFAHEATRTGLPIMRHPMLEWPDDPGTYDSKYEYLLGDAILVAPVVTEGARTRTLYLPKGTWVDYWTRQTIEGGKVVTVPAPLHQMPMLVRAGSIIPLASPDVETLAADLAGTQYRSLDNGLIWRVFAPSALSASKGSFTVYDGTKASTEQDSSRILVKGESSTIRQYEIVVNLEQPPHEVILAGKALEKLNDSGYLAHKTGWWFNSDAKTMHALFLASDFALEVKEH